MFAAVTRRDNELMMPPKENDKLTADEIDWVRGWIQAGAPWPSAARIDELRRAPPGTWIEHDGVAVATSGGLTAEWSNRKYKPADLWAYQPVRRPALPALQGLHAIDAFINDTLAHLRLEPAPPADRRTLIRRATFDLTGLPPKPEEIDAFLNDPACDDQAFAQLVERLLATPQYGEQWARHWLDVVRYADSSGLSNDYDRGNAWRYRDYVVRSLNSDKPYDAFVREQLAGDELDPDDPEMLVAVGMLRMGAWELTAMEVPKIARQRYLDDVTETIGQVFLGHALQCARCHDHKFDPVPTRDYYRMQAAFATTQIADRDAAFLATENTGDFRDAKYIEARQQQYDAIIRRIDAKMDAAGREWARERAVDYIPRRDGLRRGLSEDKLPPQHIGLDSLDLGMERIAHKGIERLKWESNRYRPVALSVYSGLTPQLNSVSAPPRMPRDPLASGELEATCVLAGGDPFSPNERVTPGVLSAVLPTTTVQHGEPGRSADDDLWRLPDTIDGRRRALAQWITSPQNSLTARVIVNRIWQWHFGQGIAGNPNNFGAMGKRPTHPELLDWLATQLMEHDWSIKAMHRTIMASQAYRRSAAHPDRALVAGKDPTGTSYAVFQPRRLDAEELYDAMLQTSGELNMAIGGVPVRPEINFEVALQPRQVMGTFAPAWQPSPLPEQRHRRAIYAARIRGLRNPLLELFNQPGSETTCEIRDVSTTVPQALTLFNSHYTFQRALAFAARLLSESDTREAAITRAFLLAFGRPPDPAEAARCLEHWDEMAKRHRAIVLPKQTYPREVVREAVEENTGEKFSFVESLDVAADFVPDLAAADVSPRVRGLAEVCLVLFNANEFVYIW
jgi:hypothetical protein